MLKKEELIHGAFVLFEDYQGDTKPVMVHSFDGDRAIFDGIQQYYTFDRLHGIKCNETSLICLGFEKTNEKSIFKFGKHCIYNLEQKSLTLSIFADILSPSANNMVDINIMWVYCIHEIQFILRAHKFPELELRLLID
jgi:hypothetical protein